MNKIGQGEPANYPKTVLAKDPWGVSSCLMFISIYDFIETKTKHSIFCIPDEPGKPGNVEVTDWDKDHVDLKWDKPENGKTYV